MMNDSTEPERPTKSPLIFLFLIGILVISTLVVASEYFLRPQIESELIKSSIHTVMEQSVSVLKEKLIKSN